MKVIRNDNKKYVSKVCMHRTWEEIARFPIDLGLTTQGHETKREESHDEIVTYNT